jgi:Rrf2 family iron-sulfur cluster assembly transcriptional regulator
MSKPSRKIVYVIEAVLEIAYSAETQPIQARNITKRLGIPMRSLEHAFQQLAHAGILVGAKGPRGGYRLARERRRITLGEIARVTNAFEANEEPDDRPAVTPLGHKVVRPLWRELEESFVESLDGITIEDLCRRAQSAGVAGEYAARLDYTI